ncbi:MAG: GntR family transcriptional regulator, partial [Pirellulaceae bacterium]|nr:GntR family transcriptional regulator [Pirellulaceae bacterium]
MNHQAKLSERIVQDVVDRLVSGRELPFRLNVLGMARHYGISRTPVREAIEELQRLGKLTKLSNGRFASTHYTEQTPLSVPVVISVRDIGDSHLDNSLGDNSLGDSHLKGLKSHLDNQSGPLKDGTVHFCPQIDSKTDGDNPVCPQIETLDNPSLSVPHVGPVSEVGHIKLSVPVSGTQVGVEKLSVPATTSGPIRTSGLSASWSHLDWRDGVRQHLVEEVVRLSLRGQTTFLREQVWSDRLEIGRGLLRQMLSELAGLGFVEHVPRRGWQVRPFDANAMLQYLEIREV